MSDHRTAVMRYPLLAALAFGGGLVWAAANLLAESLWSARHV